MATTGLKVAALILRILNRDFEAIASDDSDGGNCGASLSGIPLPQRAVIRAAASPLQCYYLILYSENFPARRPQDAPMLQLD